MIHIQFLCLLTRHYILSLKLHFHLNRDLFKSLWVMYINCHGNIYIKNVGEANQQASEFEGNLHINLIKSKEKTCRLLESISYRKKQGC